MTILFLIMLIFLVTLFSWITTCFICAIRCVDYNTKNVIKSIIPLYGIYWALTTKDVNDGM